MPTYSRKCLNTIHVRVTVKLINLYIHGYCTINIIKRRCVVLLLTFKGNVPTLTPGVQKLHSIFPNKIVIDKLIDRLSEETPIIDKLQALIYIRQYFSKFNTNRFRATFSLDVSFHLRLLRPIRNLVEIDTVLIY